MVSDILAARGGSAAPRPDAGAGVRGAVGHGEPRNGMETVPAAASDGGRPSALERLKGQRDRYEPREAEPGEDAAYDPPSGDPRERAGRTTVNTDRVDREIESLKRRVEELTKEAAEAKKRAPAEAERLERRRQAAEAELRQKDNGSYRRQHAVVSE